MRIVERFGRGGPVFSFEFFPPKSDAGVEQLIVTAGDLSKLNPAFVSITYGAGGSTRALTLELAARIKREIGIEAMAHLTCVGHSRAELEDLLQKLESDGVENVMALRGDPPAGQTAFVRPPDGFGYAQELVRFIRGRFDFCLGGASYPEGHPESPSIEDDLRHLREKVDAGVDFLITQLFFEPATYFRFLDRAAGAGIHIPIVPGVMPVTGVSQIERFTKMCGASIPQALHERLTAVRDDEEAVVQVGIEWATAQCAELLAGGAPGIHFYTLNRSHSSRSVLENLQPSRTTA